MNMPEMPHEHAPPGQAPGYAGPERRGLSADQVSLMVEESVDERVARATTEIKSHIDLKFGQVHALMQAAIADHVQQAFPNDQLHKHKEFHQGKIDAAQRSQKLSDDLFLWAIKGVIGVVIVLAGMGLLEWVRAKLTGRL